MVSINNPKLVVTFHALVAIIIYVRSYSSWTTSYVVLAATIIVFMSFKKQINFKNGE